MASDIRTRALTTKLRRLGCVVEQKNATHWKVTRVVNGQEHVSGFAARKGARYVSIHYRDQLCDVLDITEAQWNDA